MNLRLQSEVNAKLLHAGGVALAGQDKQAALAERIRELEKEIVQLKYWEREAQYYEIKMLTYGVVAYGPKSLMKSAKSSHLLCANCVGI